MLTEICHELKNWFDRGLPKLTGEFVIEEHILYMVTSDGNIPLTDKGLQVNQYYRILGSVFNDGVHKEPDTSLNDESFHGAVWFMAVPPAVITLANDISNWKQSYGDIVHNPYSSESFGGYSYVKGNAGGQNGGDISGSWQSVFKSELNKWRKL